VLLAENKLGASALLKELFGSDSFELLTATDPVTAEQAFNELSPAVVVVDIEDEDFEELAERIRAAGVKVLPIGLLERPLSLLDTAHPALR
jgi:DNA-binding response OmpR family regulator